MVKLSPEALRELLQQLAVSKVNQQQGWEFRLPTDKEFTERFPSIAEEQEQKWREKHRE